MRPICNFAHAGSRVGEDPSDDELKWTKSASFDSSVYPLDLDQSPARIDGGKEQEGTRWWLSR